MSGSFYSHPRKSKIFIKCFLSFSGMGRIKTAMIKRHAQKIFKEHADSLAVTFEENKKLIENIGEFPSKKLRNVIAGYVTRLMQNREVL